MLRIIAFVALLAITAGASHSLSAQTSPPALPEPRPAEHEIITLATTYANAIVERDVATLDRLLAHDFIDVSPAGTVSTRAHFIAGPRIHRPPRRPSNPRRSTPRARWRGSMAIPL